MHIMGHVKVKMMNQIAKRVTALYSRNKNSVYNKFKFELGGLVETFLVQNVTHLSTMILMPAHLHHILKQLSRI